MRAGFNHGATGFNHRAGDWRRRCPARRPCAAASGLDPRRHDHLANLALVGEVITDQQVLDDLLGDGRAAVIPDPNYDPFAGRSEEEKRDWLLFAEFVTCDLGAGRSGMEPKDAWCHIEWLLQRPFQNVAEWLGPEGNEFRKRLPSEQFKAAWAAFREARSDYTVADAEKVMEALQKRFEADKGADRLQ